MRTVPVFIVLMLMPVLVGCFGQEVYIVVENRSDDSLYVCLKENYADTLLPGNKYFHSGYLTPVSGSSNILKFSYSTVNPPAMLLRWLASISTCGNFTVFDVCSSSVNVNSATICIAVVGANR